MAPLAHFVRAPGNRKGPSIASRNPSLLASISDWERLAKAAGFDSAEMASLCGISQRHLQRLVKKHTGCSPTHWLRRLQCQEAKELIAQGYSSKAAAAELKFATEAHFCREFKKVFGVSPQQFSPNHLGYLALSGSEQSGSVTEAAG